MTLIKDLIDIPTQITQNDFVIRLTESVIDAEATLASYRVTDSVVPLFDKALGLIQGALGLHVGPEYVEFIAVQIAEIAGIEVVAARARRAFIGCAEFDGLVVHLMNPIF